jgi:replicative DNA helicase
MAAATGKRGPVKPTWRLADMLPETLEWIESVGSEGGAGISGVPTGLADLDALTHGLQPGSLVVVGASPAVGKSALLLDFCRSATLRNSLPSALFSLEMTRRELGLRLLSAEARMPMHVLRGGLMSDDDRTRADNRPILADLRESDVIAQAADLVILLHRPVDMAPG